MRTETIDLITEPYTITNITGKICEAIISKGAKEGACIIYIPDDSGHISSTSDIKICLSKVSPLKNTGIDTQRSYVGSFVCLTIRDFRLDIDSAQKICICDFIGGRTIHLVVQIVAMFSKPDVEEIIPEVDCSSVHNDECSTESGDNYN